ncbi:MAG: hypothetical protein V4692_06775 [Bdellovibrionota bacterium]
MKTLSIILLSALFVGTAVQAETLSKSNQASKKGSPNVERPKIKPSELWKYVKSPKINDRWLEGRFEVESPETPGNSAVIDADDRSSDSTIYPESQKEPSADYRPEQDGNGSGNRTRY